MAAIKPFSLGGHLGTTGQKPDPYLMVPGEQPIVANPPTGSKLPVIFKTWNLKYFQSPQPHVEQSAGSVRHMESIPAICRGRGVAPMWQRLISIWKELQGPGRDGRGGGVEGTAMSPGSWSTSGDQRSPASSQNFTANGRPRGKLAFSFSPFKGNLTRSLVLLGAFWLLFSHSVCEVWG